MNRNLSMLHCNDYFDQKQKEVGFGFNQKKNKQEKSWQKKKIVVTSSM